MVQTTVATNKRTFMQFLLQTKCMAHFVLTAIMWCNMVQHFNFWSAKLVRIWKWPTLRLCRDLQMFWGRRGSDVMFVPFCAHFSRGTYEKQKGKPLEFLYTDIWMHGGFNSLKTCGVLWPKEWYCNCIDHYIFQQESFYNPWLPTVRLLLL